MPKKSYSITQLSIATAILLFVSVFSYMNIYRMQETMRMINHTNIIKLQMQQLLSDFSSTAIGQRGYVFTGEADFLKQYNDGKDSIHKRLDKIRALTANNARQAENTRILEAYSKKRIAYMDGQVNVSTKVIDKKLWQQSRDFYVMIKKQIDIMTEAEDHLLSERMAYLKKQETLLPIFVILLVTGSIFTLGIGIYLLSKEIKISSELKTELDNTSEELHRSNMEIAISNFNRNLLEEVAQKFSDYTVYNEFFELLAQHLADITKIDCVLIGKNIAKEGEPPHIRTLALSIKGETVENITYPAAGNPSEKILQGNIYTCIDNCDTLFPNSNVLKILKARSYIGYPIFNMHNTAVGFIAVMQQESIKEIETVTSILKIAAKRAELEFMRLDNEDKLSKQNVSLEEKNTSLSKMNKELESFTYISSHDLQEPLRKIQIFISRILENDYDKLSENGKHYMTRTQDAASRLQRLVQDLLAYSRLKQNAMETEKISLREFIAKIREELQEELATRNASLTFSGEETVRVVPSQFNQLLNNLIYNSLKFSAPGRNPLIEINNTTVKGNQIKEDLAVPDTVYNKITVRDNGIGFDTRYKDRIFELFQRVHNESEYKGTGIGLSIVKKIIDNHDGFITADSKEDVGTVFTIYLPA